jgi:hypothetical protein
VKPDNSMKKYARPEHKSAARSLGYALTINDYGAWEKTSVIWEARLTPEELGALAWAALRALDREHVIYVAETVLSGAGAPMPPLVSSLDEAVWWASLANCEELEAYCLASFKAMPRDRQAAFLNYLQGRQAA